jgi:hypothetical protein
VRNAWFIYDTMLWYLNGKTSPPSHLVKQKIVREYAKKLGIDILVETGTYLGDMVDAHKDCFKEIYSIELHAALHERATKRFSKFPHIHILRGDSGVILPDLLSSMSRACLFWLDAHYSGGITAKGDVETPIVKEVQSILNHSVLDHAILIDDARSFDGLDGYPKLEKLEELVIASQTELVVEVENDIIRIHRPL